jgi:2-(1,2-epoxy-1,2-dihydrophenyl)acetyl-CoA isomerase
MFTYEGLGQALAMSSAEFQEGFQAALDKRSPDFTSAAAQAASSGR